MDAIALAAQRVGPHIRRTPLLACPRLTDELGAEILVKAENLQHTGSFKVRGVFNYLLSRRERGELPLGVTTFSAGNHAAAVSFGARQLGIPAVVCMRPSAVAEKIDAVRRYGGEVVLTDELFATCEQLASERGFEVLHPFDDAEVIDGHATVGREILEDAEPDLVVVPVGGGGLIGGVATAVKRGSERTRVVGVEPETANALTRALRSGRPETFTPGHTLADGLAAPFAGRLALERVRSHVDDVVEIPESSIAEAWWRMLDATKLLAEPSAAVGLAAIQLGALPVEPGATVVLVVSGGNAGRRALSSLQPGGIAVTADPR